MPRAEAAGAVNDVWARTLASYKKDLSRKDLLVLEAITSPADVVVQIERLEAKTHTGKSGAFADRVHAIIDRLVQFSNVIGAITSSNTEASLIWGSLKLLLTIVHQSSEEYEKICKSILAVSDSFPTVELVTDTFNHSDLVCGHVVDFYTSVLKFWSKALRFYKRRRIFNILRAWHDFDSEFGDLGRDMKRYGKAIEKAAAAVHMNESRTARLEQKAFNHEFLDAKHYAEKSDRHRDIVKWLAPINHEADYFVDDLRSASESCHPGTCTWILDRPEFCAWLNSDPNDAVTRLLWLTGVPGAGKTVLSSFVINRCSKVFRNEDFPPILHFFFKSTDNDKNSVIAVIRSLLYQLYSLFPAKLSLEIISLRDNSGKERALSEQGIWDLFVKYTKDLTNLVIVLDALDECDGVDVLLRRVTLLLRCSPAKIFVVSRKEENIAIELASYPLIVIGHEDVEADIRSYVTAEIERIPRFQGKSIQQRMINALSSGHEGMFLWAYLMVKELRELGTVRQVDDALKGLPRGLEEMHERIITRLNSTLHKAHRELAIKILSWVVCAVRPLRLSELQEILRFEIRQGRTASQLPVGDTVIVDDDDDLLYSEKDIELACGALVISRNETLQLIHLSTKEILTGRPTNIRSDDSRLGFYVNTQRENPRMAVLCVSYIGTHLNGIDSITRPNLETVSRLQFGEESYDPTDLVTKSPFINYASISWQVHLMDGKISLELQDDMCRLRTLLTYELTMKWIELSVALHQDILWTLERCCREIISWAEYVLIPAESSCHDAIRFLWAWSSAIVSIINDYGHLIKVYPSEIHYLDLEDLMTNDCAPGQAVLPASYFAIQGRDLKEPISQIRAVERRQASAKVEPCRQLQPNLQDPSASAQIGFMLYDNTREVYISAERAVTDDTEVLRIQDRASGRRLLPVKNRLNVSNLSCEKSGSSVPESQNYDLDLIRAVLCPAYTYLAILYGRYYGYFVTSIWLIERHLDFSNVRDRRPWARRLHCVGSLNALFVDSCLPLTAGQDGFFYCPSGQTHPDSGLQKRMPDCFVGNERSYGYLIDEHRLAFAGDGQTVIRTRRGNRLVEGFSWLNDTVTKKWNSPFPDSQSAKQETLLVAMSQTGRFWVLRTLSIDNDSPTAFTLLGSQANQQDLPINVSDDFNHFFYFSRDEQYLLVISSAEGYGLTRLSRWALAEPSFVLQAETTLFIPDFITHKFWTNQGICVAEENTQIILVNQNRILYEVDLSRLTFTDGTLQGGNISQRPYCLGEYKVSSDGHRLVAYYITCPQWSGSDLSEHENGKSMPPDSSKTRIELRFVDLSGTADQVQKIELEYFDPNAPTDHGHIVTFSPDLSMVQAGTCIFDLLAPGHPSLSFPDFLLSLQRFEKGFHISFSSCNGYLIAIEDRIARASDAPVTFGLFRICRGVGRVEKIAMNGLEDLVACAYWAAFHPMLPLVLLTCIKNRASDMKDDPTAATVIEIDLQDHQPVANAILEHYLDPSEKWYQSFKRAQYSRCGSFCFLMLHNEVLMLESIYLGNREAKLQIPAVWDGETSYNGRFYIVGTCSENIPMVKMYQAIERTHEIGLRDSTNRWRKLQPTIVGKLTAFPSHLALADVYLLVGDNKDNLVRVLFLPLRGPEQGPPEIKHLRVTLNQILAKLEESARTVEPNIEEFFRSETCESSETESVDVESEESSEVESEQVAMSADEAGSEHYETD